MGSSTLLYLHVGSFGPQDDLDKRRHSGLCKDHQTPPYISKPQTQYPKKHKYIKRIDNITCLGVCTESLDLGGLEAS